MATDALQSAAITGYGAVPPTKPASGAGASAVLQEVSGVLTNTAGATAGTYQLVRIPSNCYVKHVWWEAAACGSDAAWVCGLYYADKGSALGTVLDNDFFATDLDNTSAVPLTEITNASGTYTADLRNEPIWQAAGLSADPGGFFDVCLVTAATQTNAALLNLLLQFTS